MGAISANAGETSNRHLCLGFLSGTQMPSEFECMDAQDQERC
jgi:hypothetical protein